MNTICLLKYGAEDRRYGWVLDDLDRMGYLNGGGGYG